MKRKGFTLAEVLIVLGLIGVIAALTLPTFISNNRNQANATKLATTVNALENAISAMLASDATGDLTDTAFFEALSNSRYQEAEGELGKYFKINKRSESLTGLGYDSASPFRKFNTNTYWAPSYNTAFLTKNGAVVTFLNFGTKRENAATVGIATTYTPFIIYIDVNGTEKPNMAGRDVFGFSIADTGTLHAEGSKPYNYNRYGQNSDWKTYTSNCNYTSRLVENGYKVDY